MKRTILVALVNGRGAGVNHLVPVAPNI